MKPVVVEKNEYLKNQDGEVLRVNRNMPSHDDKELIFDSSVKKVKSGKGGLVLNGVESVLSATHENRSPKAKSYTEKDEEIKFLPSEAKEFIKQQFNLDIKPKSSLSPAKVVDLVMNKVDSISNKYKNLKSNNKSTFSFNATKANKIVLDQLPQLEDVYDFVFNYTESKKEENNLNEVEMDGDIDDYAQRGKEPLYVDSPNHPRYKAYQDSLNLYPKGESEYKRNPDGGYGEFKHEWSGGKWKRNILQQGGKDPDQEIRNKAYRTLRPSDETDINNYARWLFNNNREEWDDAVSEEAWAKYLNQNRKSKYLSPSKYTTPKEWGTKYPHVKEYVSLHPNFEKDLMYTYWNQLKNGEERIVNEHQLKSRDFQPVDIMGKGDLDDMMTSRARVLRNYTVRKNKDANGEYLEYFDIYDLPEFAEKKVKGNPYGIYNKIYSKQTGGTNQKGVLNPYPNMKNFHPEYEIRLNSGKTISVPTLDGRTANMEDVYAPDSVIVQNDKAKTFFNSKLQKYIK